MALVTTADILHDGTINAVVQLTGFTDEIGDPEPIVAVAVRDMTPAARAVKVTGVEWTVGAGTVILAWATATGSEPFVNLTGQGCLDYGLVNGALSRSGEATGDILLSTDGFDDGSNFTVKLRMRKRF